MNQKENNSGLRTDFKKHLSKLNETTTEKERALFETSLQNYLDNKDRADSNPVARTIKNPVLLSDTSPENIKPSENSESGKVYSEYLDGVNFQKLKDNSKATKEGSNSMVTSAQNASNQSISSQGPNVSDKSPYQEYLDKDRMSTTKLRKQSGTEQKQPSGHSKLQLGKEQDKKLIQQTPKAAKLEIELKTLSQKDSAPDNKNTDANDSQGKSSMPADQAEKLPSTDKERRQSDTGQEQPSGHSQLVDGQKKKLILHTPGAGKIEIELEPRTVNAFEPDKTTNANDSQDKGPITAYQEGTNIPKPSEAGDPDSEQNKVHVKTQAYSQALNINWEARANSLKNFVPKSATQTNVSPAISTDPADAVTEKNQQPSVKNGTLPSWLPNFQNLNNKPKVKPLKKWVWNFPRNDISESIRPIGTDENRKDLYSIVKSAVSSGTHKPYPTGSSTTSEEKNISSNKADENYQKSYHSTNSTSKRTKSLGERTGFYTEQNAGATKVTERTAKEDIHDDGSKRISSRAYAKSVSASSRSGRSETKTVYIFDKEAEKIEVFVDNLLRARIVKNSTGDSYISDWKDCDLPTSKRVRATTVIHANGSKFKTVRVCDGIQEAISVYKDEILLCKIGSKVA